jgi:O-antigen ligase/Flp pilus assembly protein TadD
MAQKPVKKTFSSDWLVKTIKYGLFGCLFMPLIIHSSFIFPYIFPKQAFFQILVEIIFGLYLFLAMKEPRFRPRYSWLFRALLIYFVVLILSSVFGQNTFHSFWSNYERMAGVIAWIHYFGFLFIAVNIFKTKEDWQWFFDWAIIASVIEAFYALGQLVGLFTSSTGVRVDGTIGNSSFLAGYLLINALFAGWLFLEKKNFNWRIFYLGAMLLNLFIMYETRTRGALLALFAGLFCLALFFIFAPARGLSQLPIRQPQRIKKYAAGLIIFIILAGGLIWLGKDTALIKKFPTLKRLANISLTEATSQTRLLSWKMGLKGFTEHPVFGWGPENFNILFNKYYDPYLYPVESWFDRSHNAFLDILVNTGLMGFLAYLSIFVLSFYYLWRSWRQNKTNYQTAAIFSVILIAYAVQNFFVFDTQVTLLMIFLIWSYFVSLSFNEEKNQKVGVPANPNLFFKAIIILLVFGLFYFVNLRPGIASREGIKALQILQTGNIAEASAQFRVAYKADTYGLPEIAARAYDTSMQILNSAQITKENKEQFVQVAIDGLNETLKLEPTNARYMMMLGNLYLSAATQLDPKYLSDADYILSQAIVLSPTRQELLFSLGQLRMYEGKKEEALSFFKKAVELNDTVDISHWNYGIIAIALGEKKLGEAEVQIARPNGLLNADDYQKLINAYGQTSDFTNIISIYQKWIAADPRNPQIYASLASAYAQSGDKQKAKEAALMAAKIDSSFQAEAEQFIKNLGL